MEIIRGRVETGLGLAKKMGYPTLNIPYSGDNSGVFAAKVFFNGAEFPAIVHLGPKPTFAIDRPICEIHMLVDFPSVLDLELRLVEKIRDVRKFPNAEDLKSQIALDLKKAKKILGIALDEEAKDS